MVELCSLSAGVRRRACFAGQSFACSRTEALGGPNGPLCLLRSASLAFFYVHASPTLRHSDMFFLHIFSPGTYTPCWVIASLQPLPWHAPSPFLYLFHCPSHFGRHVNCLADPTWKMFPFMFTNLYHSCNAPPHSNVAQANSSNF